jgi:hypothetical protein
MTITTPIKRKVSSSASPVKSYFTSRAPPLTSPSDSSTVIPASPAYSTSSYSWFDNSPSPISPFVTPIHRLPTVTLAKRYFTSNTQLQFWDLTDKSEWPIDSPVPSPDYELDGDSPISPMYPTSTFLTLKVKTCFSPAAIPWSPSGVPVAAPLDTKRPKRRSKSMTLKDIFLSPEFNSQDVYCPMKVLFEYLDWVDLSILDYVTASPRLGEVREVLKIVLDSYKISHIEKVYKTPDTRYCVHNIMNLKYFETPQLLDSKYGLPVCCYLAGLFNRLRELIPGFPDRSYPMDTLVNTLLIFITDPESSFRYLPRQLLHHIYDPLLEFQDGVLEDAQYRKVIGSYYEPWRFNFPFLTREYLRVCELGGDSIIPLNVLKSI